jgi:hypothetical protein
MEIPFTKIVILSKISFQRKGLIISLTYFLLISTIHFCFSSNDNSRSNPKDIHVVGDGNLCVFGRESNIFQFFGPPYSSPSMMQLQLLGNDSVISFREKGAAIWHHKIERAGGSVAQMTDFISSETGSFVREISAAKEVSYELLVTLDPSYLNFNQMLSCTRDSGREMVPGTNQSFTIRLQKDVPFYGRYAMAPKAYTYRIFVSGCANLIPLEDSGKKLSLLITPGKGTLVIVSGLTPEAIDSNMKKWQQSSTEELARLTRKRWQSFSAKLEEFYRKQSPEGFAKAVDDIAVLLKSMQSSQGVVMAGYSWHWGYVRDQYGASRGLMAMGLYEEARQTLNFFYDTWEKYGFIKNAQPMGFSNVFLFCENQEVEMTGYLVIQAFDYYNKTRDDQFIRKILPLLEWATQVQSKNIVDGMLPFSGDETHIAGGLLPRKVICNGSAESTLYFIEGSNRLLDFVRQHKLWDYKKIKELQANVKICSDGFRKNFFIDGIFYANNPAREKDLAYPPTRPSVCTHPDHPVEYFPENYHFKGPLYFCANCMKKDNSKVQLPKQEKFTDVLSATLCPIYMDSKLFTRAEKRQMLDAVIAYYRKNGSINHNGLMLGHDYGMFLGALVAFDDPLQDEIYTRMMNLRDRTGSWAEYFMDDKPLATVCHPWSAGVNIEAAIRYVSNRNDRKP